ncbi:hypothetical protein PMA4326_020155 [Pseudomonas syringae pv. maculicola str. ES4326]|uniref:Uncharacterized protein n=1 Tax=Pseudomonas syringae pv. maculicola str. ES4326 TaxID=629265 RepID=A0A8T8C5N3_PSEYM|nr:hypothetical protein PMA4326_020155 [Pseudomonas syringae pv. maculicola str. ES4326]
MPDKGLPATVGSVDIACRLCTKSRRAKVRQGKNRQGTAGVAFDSTGCK